MREQPRQPFTPPHELEVDWVNVEQGVANFDHLPPQVPQPAVVAPPPLELQQPHVVLQYTFVPVNFVPPQPMPEVDWGIIACAPF